MPAAAAKSAIRSSKKAASHIHQYTLSELKAEVEAQRRRMAQQAEAACHIQGNINGPDLGEFEQKLKLCDFA